MPAGAVISFKKTQGQGTVKIEVYCLYCFCTKTLMMYLSNIFSRTIGLNMSRAKVKLKIASTRSELCISIVLDITVPSG